MAEIAAAAWAVEEVVSTGVQAGAAGYAVAKPTMPAKAVWSQLATTADDASAASLTRSHHTVTMVGTRGYVFGGKVGAGLADNSLHSFNLSVGTPDYHVLPALPARDGGPVPSPRASHAACAHEQSVVVYGGCTGDGVLVEQDASIWLYDTQQSTWDRMQSDTHIERMPPPRSHAHIFSHGRGLVLYGGKDDKGSPMPDAWHYDLPTKTWNQLPTAPAATHSAALAGDTLYLVAQGDNLASHLHCLDIKLFAAQPPEWTTRHFPTNPLTPGPPPRDNGGMLPVSTGHGRNFLLYFFGEHHPIAEQAPTVLGDMWTLQLPSSNVQLQPKTAPTEAVKPAKIKDEIRTQVGADTGLYTWCETEVQSSDNAASHDTNAQPGPRSCFGSSHSSDGKMVMIWGGIGADGERKGDGWLLHLG